MTFELDQIDCKQFINKKIIDIVEARYEIYIVFDNGAIKIDYGVYDEDFDGDLKDHIGKEFIDLECTMAEGDYGDSETYAVFYALKTIAGHLTMSFISENKYYREWVNVRTVKIEEAENAKAKLEADARKEQEKLKQFEKVMSLDEKVKDIICRIKKSQSLAELEAAKKHWHDAGLPTQINQQILSISTMRYGDLVRKIEKETNQ